MSKLDYCNALLPGSSKMLLTKLQCIQNMACRIVCSLKKFDCITRPMYDLHWLYIQGRIDYKIACSSVTKVQLLNTLWTCCPKDNQSASWDLLHLMCVRLNFSRHLKDTTHPFPHMAWEFGMHYHLSYDKHKVLTLSGRGLRHICLRLHMTRTNLLVLINFLYLSLNYCKAP